jgi:hypothetical protein
MSAFCRETCLNSFKQISGTLPNAINCFTNILRISMSGGLLTQRFLDFPTNKKHKGLDLGSWGPQTLANNSII